MAINYIVKAQVIDITADIPKAEDVLLINLEIYAGTPMCGSG